MLYMNKETKEVSFFKGGKDGWVFVPENIVAWMFEHFVDISFDEKEGENSVDETKYLVKTSDGEYVVRENTGVGTDTIIMKLLEGCEVLTRYKEVEEWYQWKPSESLTDYKGEWVLADGGDYCTFEHYLNAHSGVLEIIDLRCEAPKEQQSVNDVVNHPQHYTSDESGVECIQLTSLLPCCISNSLKYVWRCGKKDEDLQELKKALFYINYSIENNLPSFISGCSDTLEFEELIGKVKEHWTGYKYMFIDAVYWGNQQNMKKALENIISEIELNSL